MNPPESTPTPNIDTPESIAALQSKRILLLERAITRIHTVLHDESTGSAEIQQVVDEAKELVDWGKTNHIEG